MAGAFATRNRRVESGERASRPAPGQSGPGDETRARGVCLARIAFLDSANAASGRVLVHDNIELELPLQIVAPLFLAQQAPPAWRPQTQLNIDKSIPNSFFWLSISGNGGTGRHPGSGACARTHAPRPRKNRWTPNWGYRLLLVWGDNTDKPRIDASEYTNARRRRRQISPAATPHRSKSWIAQ